MQSKEICNACKLTIRADKAFERNLIMLKGIIMTVSEGQRITEELVAEMR